jgi:multidrug efflux pump subunit AcrA (membrane-fusion protein)
MKKRWLFLFLPLLLLLWWGLGRGDAGPVAHFSSAKEATIESTVATNGKVEPAESAAARAETAGVVRSISVQRGQMVKAGETLVALDSAAARSSLAAALAQEEQARAENATVRQGGRTASLASANAAIIAAQTAVTVAQRNYDSTQRLFKQQAATKLQLDDARDALDRSKLQLTAAQEQRQALVGSSDRSVAEAKLNDAQAAVGLAKHQLSLESITSPIAGTVYQFDLKLGAYLQAGDLVAMVGQLESMKVTVYVDEPDLGRVGVGMPVAITWDARPGQKWWGRVDKLPTEVVALGSRTVGEVTTVVDNPNHDLLPGVSVNATIVAKVASNTLSIPKAALRTLRASDGVYKLVGKHIEWTPVATGVSDINRVQILSGLKPGDRVLDRVIDPSDAEIKNGMNVKAQSD